MSQVRSKSISLAQAILAALWHGKSFPVKSITRHPYVQLLSNNKHPGTHRSTISRLIKGNLIKRDNDNLALTEIGYKESLLAFIKAESALYKTNFFQKWDGAWRILFFDIPESKRRHRDYIRKVLKRVGFKEMQKSIWVYPYPVPSFLKELISHEEVRAHIRFITTDSLDNDSDIKKLFNLG